MRRWVAIRPDAVSGLQAFLDRVPWRGGSRAVRQASRQGCLNRIREKTEARERAMRQNPLDRIRLFSHARRMCEEKVHPGAEVRGVRAGSCSVFY